MSICKQPCYSLFAYPSIFSKYATYYLCEGPQVVTLILPPQAPQVVTLIYETFLRYFVQTVSGWTFGRKIMMNEWWFWFRYIWHGKLINLAFQFSEIILLRIWIVSLFWKLFDCHQMEYGQARWSGDDKEPWHVEECIWKMERCEYRQNNERVTIRYNVTKMPTNRQKLFELFRDFSPVLLMIQCAGWWRGF